MNFNSAVTFCNLRILGTVKEDQYLSTDSNGDLIGVYEDSYLSSLTSAMWGENWESTKKALTKLFVVEIPQLIAEYKENDKEREMERLRDLICLTEFPLEHLKKIWGAKREEYGFFIESIHMNYMHQHVCNLEEDSDNEDDNIEDNELVLE